MISDENKYLFTFAWRSIRRNSGRSFFIGFSVSLAVLIAVWVVSFFEGMNHQIEEAVVNTNTGFFQLQEQNFAQSTDSSFARALDQNLLKKIEGLPLKSFSPELILDSNISTPEGATGLMAIGIEPNYHRKFLPIADHISKGEFLSRDDTRSIVIGKELATIFKFNVGDQMVLNYQDHRGELRSEIVSIKGIYHFNSRSFEKRFVYLSQKTLQNFYFKKISNDILFNRITMMTDDLLPLQKIQATFKDSGLKVKTWKDLNPEMAVVLDFHDGMIKLFFIIIGLTITMTILAPVQMLWQERYPELKMMNVLGVSVKKFWKIGLFEILQMILCSAVFSSILLVTILGVQSQTGINFEFLNKEGVPIERAGIKLPGIIYPRFSVDQLIIILIFVIFVLSFSYLWSIHRTLKKIEGEM